jgi:MFS family permease
LLLFRAISGVAAAALGGVIAVVANDYPAETSRGRLHGYAGVMNGLGVLFMSVVVAQIPALLRPQGVTAVQAGQVMFLTVATLGVISALIFRAGLKPGTGTAAHQRADWRRLLTSGIRAARNPRIVLAYACAFTGRSDTAIKGTFISLWAVSVAPDAGMTTAEALARAGMIIGIMGVVALPWMPLFGHLLDRINRVTGVAIAMGLAGVGFSSMYFVTSPLDFAMIPAFVLLSIGQLSAISASITLVGQEAPAAERGGVIAMSGWFGALGILLAAVIGGRLFDSWGPFAPFVLAGVVQLAFCAYAVVLRIVAPGPMTAAVTA